MPSPKPFGTYTQQLSEEFQNYHQTLLDKGKRRRPGDSEDERPVTNEKLATDCGIDPAEWNKVLNNKANISKEFLFRLISSRIVSGERAKRWVLLWLANELDSFHIPAPTRTSERNLGRVADFLVMMADYVPTLGVVDLIHRERESVNQKFADSVMHLPKQGPNIHPSDYRSNSGSGLATTLHGFHAKQPINILANRFARLLVRKELAEREDSLRAFAQEELIEETEKPVEMGIADEKDDDFPHALLSEIDRDVESSIAAAAATVKVIKSAKRLPKAVRGEGSRP